jgi:hypothetical protein
MEADDFEDRGSAASLGRLVPDQTIFERLDALEAERVIRRALELEAEALDQPHQFSAAQLERIAAEIEMDPVFVRQASARYASRPASVAASIGSSFPTRSSRPRRSGR